MDHRRAHVGVVVGLAILTPVFTADLQEAQAPAEEAIASLVLDAALQPQDKIAVAEALGGSCPISRARSRPAPRLRDAGRPARGAGAVAQLERDLDEQLSGRQPGPSATRSSSVPAWRSLPC